MLVKFTSSTSGQIMMFAQTARQLLDIVGKECNARGVITTEQLPGAIERLRVAVADEKGLSPGIDEEPNDVTESDDHDQPSRVGLRQRAYPLIELLVWTSKEDGFVLWEAAKDF
ncbi:DUF1840 domain-containing protein [Accumulibacter sp.]|nr:DUF1840 domain-containing protein [Accumulibacter sp.]MBL8374498.1 DUF1840 domain-containing protein [Accumulibacter sp.]